MNSLHQKVTPWVSYFVLVGCVCITAMLVYMSRQAYAVGDEWGNPGDTVTEFFSN